MLQYTNHSSQFLFYMNSYFSCCPICVISSQHMSTEHALKKPTLHIPLLSSETSEGHLDVTAEGSPESSSLVHTML